MDIRYHHTRKLINQKKIKLQYIKTNKNLANGLTKYLNTNSLNNIRESIIHKLWNNWIIIKFKYYNLYLKF